MAVVAVVVLVVSLPAPSAAEPGPAIAKYTVVESRANGQRDTLFAIALETLGDGRRYSEILELNRGRIQPDGERMTDVVIEPGWILLLPADAGGARVRTGVVPSFPPGGISASPQPTRSLPGAAEPSALPMRAAAVSGAVVLLGVALFVRRSRRPASPAPETVPGTTPELAAGPGELRLVGARDGTGGTAVVFVEAAGGRQPVDLALAPDAFTVVGDRAEGLRFARVLIAQLWAAGVPLTVVGSELMRDRPEGCAGAGSVAELPEEPSFPAAPVPHVFVCAVRAGEELLPLVRLMSEPGARVVLIGDVPPARWSLRLS
ncbi:LysM peptidoglycan-binding domain-containing protein [Dactylosporangium sp. CA-152071]|uniref:LysM peptidoglycan-binding domain-containing protein n=1 Tax=Dactylosporangium sp. CA-152071 TaxID=3239933 RepID=UPI003D8EF326